MIYSLDNIDNQSAIFNKIKEDYLYNFSLFLNRALIGPEMLQLVLTTKCNLQCKMCGVWDVREEELGTVYVKKLIDDAYKMGNLKEVYFTGGEALLRSDIFSLIKYVIDYYPHVRTHLNTNGTLLTKKTIDRILDVELESLGISIDSPVPEIHNALRGPGVFEKIIEAVNYLNAQKKKRNTISPRLSTCSVMMDQTLDTMYDMLEFCVKYEFSGIHVQPYVCNSDLRGKRNDEFWIKEERLPLLGEVLRKIESKRGEILTLYIEVPGDKIYKYFSEPVYIDKCYVGFTRALLVGKKINFVCNGPNNELYQHFGVGDQDSINEAWFSDKADFFRNTIKNCKKNCSQLCSIRPSSDSVEDIHKRLMERASLFLTFRELHLLGEHINKFPGLPIREILLSDFNAIVANMVKILDPLDLIKSDRKYSVEAAQYFLSDLKILDAYVRNGIDNIDPTLFSNKVDNKNRDALDILREALSYKKNLRGYFNVETEQ